MTLQLLSLGNSVQCLITLYTSFRHNHILIYLILTLPLLLFLSLYYMILFQGLWFDSIQTLYNLILTPLIYNQTFPFVEIPTFHFGGVSVS